MGRGLRQRAARPATDPANCVAQPGKNCHVRRAPGGRRRPEIAENLNCDRDFPAQAGLARLLR